MKKSVKKVLAGIAVSAWLWTSCIGVFAAGYEVIKEPWLDADMGSMTAGDEYYSYERGLSLYPTVFKNGESIIHEKAWIMPGQEATYYCESMYKVDIAGNMITDRKYADDFNVNYEYDWQHVALEEFKGSYISEYEGLLFFPNEWTWLDNDLEYQKSEKYSNYEDTESGYEYYEWADIQSIFVNDEFGTYNEVKSSSKYYNGVASAFYNGKVGIIDESDNVIVPFAYDMILPVAENDGYTWALKDGKWGIIKIDTKPVAVKVNEKELNFDQIPLIINGRTLAPLRAIFEALDATVEWDDSTQTITSVKGNTTVSMTIGKNEMYKNGEMIWLDEAPQIVGERTLVPVRAIAEAFDCNVNWDDETQTVIITN